MKSLQLLALGILTFFTMCTAVTAVGVVTNPVFVLNDPTMPAQPTNTTVSDQTSTAIPLATFAPAAESPTTTPTRLQEKPAEPTTGMPANAGDDMDGSIPSQAAKKEFPDRGLPDTGDLLELLPGPTATPTPIPTPTETTSQLLKSRIVFYLILPEHGHTDACGNPTLIPIISQRHRTGDKLRDMQIGLQMLFDLGVKYYGPYYNALWDTKLTINSVEYRKQEDYAIIDFGGFLPVMQMSKCDKRGVRNQIWKTFFHYEFREKTFTINGAFLIDQLNR
jgi:hypothetical protein